MVLKNSTTAKLYDALIIGGGPAGLSAALGLGRIQRSCIVFSDDSYRNDGVEASHAVLGHDHQLPRDIWARSREQIKRYNNTTYEQTEIVTAKRQKLAELGGRHGFVVGDTQGRSWIGRSIVLATGVKDVFPNIPGYAENWPRNIYQCPFCDGFEKRHERRAVLCYPSFSIHHAKTVSMVVFDQDQNRNYDKIVLLTNGDPNPESKDDIAKALEMVQTHGCKVDSRKVVRMVNVDGKGESIDVYLQDEQGKEEAMRFGCVFHKPPTELRGMGVIQGLGLETTPGMFGEVVKANGFMQNTNVPGVFVAGDSANAMTQVTIAISSGVASAGGVAHYLIEEDDAVLAERLRDSSKGGADMVAAAKVVSGPAVELCSQDPTEV